METEKILNEISIKLSALLGLALEKNDNIPSIKDKVKLLNRYGLSNQIIADIIGTSKGTIEVTKTNLKSKS